MFLFWAITKMENSIKTQKTYCSLSSTHDTTFYRALLILFLVYLLTSASLTSTISLVLVFKKCLEKKMNKKTVIMILVNAGIHTPTPKVKQVKFE